MRIELLLTILILNISIVSIAQKSLTKKELLATFKNTYHERKVAGYKFSEWSICNVDSAFYKKDTLDLISDHSWFLNNGCCETINLAFFSKRSFLLNAINGCKGFTYTVHSVGSPNKYVLSFYSDQASVFVIFKNQKEKFKFKILSTDNVKPFYRDIITVKLLRIQ